MQVPLVALTVDFGDRKKSGTPTVKAKIDGHAPFSKL